MQAFRPPNTATAARRNTVLAAIGMPLAFILAASFSNGSSTLLVGLAIIPLVIVPLSILAIAGPSRMQYLVGEGVLEARTIFGQARFNLSGAIAKKYVPGRMLRVGGTAMPGYYTGRWREGGQPLRVYATTFANAVLVTTPTARVLLSPTTPEALLEALRTEGTRVTEDTL